MNEQGMVVDNCIAVTKLAVMTLRAFAIDAKPGAAKVIIFNAEAVAILEAGGDVEMVKAGRGGAHSIGIGYGIAGAGRYLGHLVAIVENEVLLDLSLDQASRTNKGIALVPTILRLKGQALDSTPLSWTTREGVQLIYSFHNDKTYTSAPDWRRDSIYKPMVGVMVRRIEAALNR